MTHCSKKEKLMTENNKVKNPIMGIPAASEPKVVTGDHGYVLEDVPHLADYIPNLPVCHLLLTL